jgi:protoporphyrinogen oxidase
LAGLSAARELSSNIEAGKPVGKVLLLEADSRLGGRIRTENRDGIVCETGSIFAFNPEWFDFPVDAGRHYENDYPVGLFHRGRLHTGESVTGCVRSMYPHVRHQICLPVFLSSPNPQEEMIGEDLASAMKAFFRVIHPGSPVETVPARRRDCLVRHRADHFARGNGAMIDALAARSRVEIKTDSRVYRLEQTPHENGGKSVKVFWRNGAGAEQEASARRVVLAAQPSAAREICGETGNVSRDFLARVRCGGGIAAVLHCRAAIEPRMSYMVSTQGNFNTFIFHRVFDKSGAPKTPDESVITGYIVAERAAACGGMDDAELTRLMIDELRAANIGEFAADNCSLLETRPWPEVGPIIEEAAYRGFSAAWLHPMPGVVLAGDYTWWDGAMLPYGMRAAVASGRRAARLCLEPDFEPISVDFGRMPLAETTVLRDGGSGPELAEIFRDGTIAYYGLLLRAANTGKERFPLNESEYRDIELYLLEEAVDGLWGYQRDYGVTSLDSALVMEGLMSAGRHEERLRESCRRLADTFFDREEGGFRTMPAGSPGRAPYWRGTDCPATAYCAWLLTRIDPESYAEEITLCRDYLLRNQRVSGGWPGKWFPSRTIPIWYALRFFASLKDSPRDSSLMGGALERAVCRLLSWQSTDGSWSGSVIETSAAILALATAPSASRNSASLSLGREWLRSVKGPDGWPGEPILAYRFEENGERALFFTRDLGRVTSAWAALALAPTGVRERS